MNDDLLAALLQALGHRPQLGPPQEQVQLRGATPPDPLRLLYRQPEPDQQQASPPNFNLRGGVPWQRP